MAGLDPTPVLELAQSRVLGGSRDNETAKRAGVDRASDYEIASLLGVQRATVNAWRKGRNKMSPEMADRVADQLGYRPEVVWPDVFGVGEGMVEALCCCEREVVVVSEQEVREGRVFCRSWKCAP